MEYGNNMTMNVGFSVKPKQNNFFLKNIEIASFKHCYKKLTLFNRAALFLYQNQYYSVYKHNKLKHKIALRAHTVRQLRTIKGKKDKKTLIINKP